MLAAEDEEEDGANGEKEKEDGQDNDGDEVGVEGVIHGGGDDGGKGEGGLEKGEVPQGCLPVFQTALYLKTQIELMQMASTFNNPVIVTFLRISRPTAVSVIIGLKWQRRVPTLEWQEY